MGGVVFVGVFLTGVQHRAVVEQLHVAGLKTHLDMERRIVGDALGQSECRTLVVVSPGASGWRCESRMYQATKKIRTDGNQ